MNSRDVRKSFLDYFASHGHKVVESYPLIPLNDPTLMFTNAGMVQFKNVFTGQEKRDFKRAASSQKCMRVSGKHNDLENVGVTPRHHTFFEMLGNFSFGDYFKEEAIYYGWDFLTRVMGLPKERLYAAVYEDDDEAFTLWKKIAGLSDAKILRRGEKDNFWAMGPTGPCGPCSEIHYDMGPDFPEEDRELEIWNLVFMQYERFEDGRMEPLPRPSIDTGMGFERLVALMQGAESNYHTDLFMPVIELVAGLAGKRYARSASEDDVGVRVIADHSRAAAFLIADHVMPSNEGRGYVLRRIMRRAIRHAKKLNLPASFYDKAVECVIETMGGVYPELAENRKLIIEVAKNEEERFRATLDAGLEMIKNNKLWIEREGKRIMPGETVFKLKDTYGFPEDLTRVIGEEQGFSIDYEGFEKALEEQRSRSEWKGSGEAEVGALYLNILAELGDSEFLGYSTITAEGEVKKIIKGGEIVEEAKAPVDIEFITGSTPFYGESGGQIGDTGVAFSGETQLEITDAIKPTGGLIVHKAKLTGGSLKVGQKIMLRVEGERRDRIRANHTATHILHYALQKTLGEHVRQAGSLVEPSRLRFDYNAMAAPTSEQLEEIERLANELVYRNYELVTEIMDIGEAKKSGAKALFGEKYAEKVRVVSCGPTKELCGGTHVTRSGDIGLIKITSESSVAAGVRRIEAATRDSALAFVQERVNILETASEALKCAPNELNSKIEKRLYTEKELRREIERLNRKLAMGGGAKSEGDLARDVLGVKLITIISEVSDPKMLAEMVDNYKEQIKSGVVVVGAKNGDKALLAAGVTPDLLGKIKAGDIVKELATILGGSGGGRADFARAGGTQPEKLDKIPEAAYNYLERTLKGE